MPVDVLIQLHLWKACWEIWLSDGQPHSDYSGQWQIALCIVSALQSSQPIPQRNRTNSKMYTIEHIKICAERKMLPKPRLDLSGTPGLRAIGLSPGSWQTSLDLGSMSWHYLKLGENLHDHSSLERNLHGLPCMCGIPRENTWLVNFGCCLPCGNSFPIFHECLSKYRLPN